MENQNDSEITTQPLDESPSLLKQFYLDLVMVLTEPTRFFKTRADQLSFNYALGFGLAISWIAAFISWVTRVLKNETLLDGFLKLKKQLEQMPGWKELPADIWAQGNSATSAMPGWVMEVIGIIVNPFQTLISFFIYGFIFWIGSLILVPQSSPKRTSVAVRATVKITAIAGASTLITALLGFLPFGLGGFVGYIFHVFLLVIGFSEQFSISRMRGLGIVFLPTIVSVILFSCLIGLVITVFAGLIASLFH